jgi:hypothetical protein
VLLLTGAITSTRQAKVEALLVNPKNANAERVTRDMQ